MSYAIKLPDKLFLTVGKGNSFSAKKIEVLIVPCDIDYERNLGGRTKLTVSSAYIANG